jgi:hypothetical protein
MDFSVYALYPDGGEYWSFVTEGQVHSSPVIVDDGTLYIGNKHTIKALFTDSYGLANSIWPVYRSNPKRDGRRRQYVLSMNAIKLLIRKLRFTNLGRGNLNSLTTKLDSAIKSLDNEKADPAVNKMYAFINEVDALSDRKISSRYADILVFDALDVIENIMPVALPPR